MIEGCLKEAKNYVEGASIKWQGGVLLGKRSIVGTPTYVAAPKSGTDLLVIFCIPAAAYLTREAGPHRN